MQTNVHCEAVFRGVFYACCNIQARDWMELHAHICIGMTGLLPLRRWGFVPQPGHFALLQRMRQRRTPHRTGTIPPVGVQVHLSKLGNKIKKLNR